MTAGDGRDRAHPRPPHLVLLALAALALLLAAVVVHQVAVVEHATERARSAFRDGVTALEAGDADTAVARFEDLVADVDRAVRTADGPVWTLLERVPGLDRSIRPARVTIATADAATDLAVGILVEIAGLRRPDGTSAVRDPGGGFDLAPVEDVAARIAAMDPAPLEARLAALEATSTDGALGRVRRGRDEVIAEAHRLLAFTADAQALARVLPGFLGADGPREYFLAMQNNGELRGTGGLIGFFATIRVDEGRLELSDPERYEVLDQTDVATDGEVRVPAGLDPGFMERYGDADATVFLGNANLDPDLPTVSSVMLDLYERERGRRLDGVIVLDPIGLAYVHSPIGPVQVPDHVHAPGMDRTIDPGDLAHVLMVRAYDQLGGDSPERKAFLQVVAEAAFGNVASGDWSAIEMLRRVGETAGAKHLQVFSTRDDEQAVFEDLGIAGAMDPPQDADFLAVTANNAAGNKSDVHVAHRLGIDVRLAPGGDDGEVRRSTETVVEVENPLGTTGHDRYIIGSSEPGQGFTHAFTGPRGLNRTWFTVWSPDDTEDFAITNAEGRTFERPYVTSLHGLRAVDHTLETPARSTRSFTATTAGPVEVAPTGDGFVYRLRLHRQSKGIPDRIRLRIAVDAAWEVVSGTVEGGGADPGFGPDGAPGPAVEARVEDGAVVVTGDVTRAVMVEVRVRTTTPRP